jgi:hypothetical protein
VSWVLVLGPLTLTAMALPELPDMPDLPASLDSVTDALPGTESLTEVGADAVEALSGLEVPEVPEVAAVGEALGSAAKVAGGVASVAGAAAAIKKPKTGGSSANKGPGRFTPKGSTSANTGGKKATGAGEKLPSYASSGRYTAKSEKAAAEELALQTTRPWIPWLMFALLAIGGLLIVLNYVGVWPNAPSNWYLLGGIVAITGGFITATQLR